MSPPLFATDEWEPRPIMLRPYQLMCMICRRLRQGCGDLHEGAEHYVEGRRLLMERGL